MLQDLASPTTSADSLRTAQDGRSVASPSESEQSAPSIQIEIVESTGEAIELLPWWISRASTPLQSPEWLLSWWEAFAHDYSAKLHLLVMREGPKVIGLAPLMRNRSLSVVRTLQWLGSGKACTDFQHILVKPEHQSQVHSLLADWLLAGDDQGSWDFIELDGVSDTATYAPLLERLKSVGATIEQSSQESTWRLPLDDGFAGFMSSLSKTQRAQARNLLNRFDKSDSMSFRMVEGAGAVNELHTLIDLHQQRWQAVGEVGCFADQRFEKFLRLAVERLSLRNRVELAVLEDGGKPIGALLSLRDAAGNLYVYQTGRDPSYEQARIGQILNFVAVRHACERGIRFIDYLRGDEIYKGRLGAHPTPCSRIRIFAPSLMARLPYHALHLGKLTRDGMASLHDAGRSAIQRLIATFRPHA